MTASASGRGVSGRTRSTGTGRSAMCFETTTRLGPWNGGAPASISYATMPSAYRSLRPSISSPAACSGLMYAGVPTATPCPVLVLPPSPAIARAIPKSASMARPVAARAERSPLDVLVTTRPSRGVERCGCRPRYAHGGRIEPPVDETLAQAFLDLVHDVARRLSRLAAWMVTMLGVEAGDGARLRQEAAPDRQGAWLGCTA
jgi:hypothetical protein